MATACRGEPTTVLDRADRVKVLPSASLTDTIGAQPNEAVVVEVRDDNGAPRARAVVRFAVIPFPDSVRAVGLPALVAAPSGGTYGRFFADSTDLTGRAKVLVGFGDAAGSARVTVNVPELGLTDTMVVTVLPGHAAKFAITPRDTSVNIGAHYHVGAVATDRTGNPIATAAVDYASPSPNISIDLTGTVAARDAGRALVVLRSGVVTDTAHVSVLPPGRIVTFDWHDFVIATVNLDGTGLQILLHTVNGSTHPHATRNAAQIVYYEKNPSTDATISIVAADGQPHVLVSTPSAAWPRWTGDEQWIYFTVSQNGRRAVARIHPDGTGQEVIAAYDPGSDLAAVGVASDGSRVVVNEAGSLLVIDVATRNARRIPVTCVMPQFSPDGNRIACRTNAQLIVMNQDGSGVVRSNPTFSLYAVGNVEWSPDGKWILVMTIAGPALMSPTDGSSMLLPLGDHYLQAAFVP